jgi:hypothetical protein
MKRGRPKIKTNYAGRTYHRLTVIEELGAGACRCSCACGTVGLFRIAALVNGNTKSCGCLKYKRQGLSRSTEFKTWYMMQQRCYNQRNARYASYGKRGIYVCQRWRDSFELFLADMGNRPSPKHTLERKDNDGPYSKENCIWALWETQHYNKTSTLRIECSGKTLTTKEWSEVTGIPQTTLRTRLKNGWSAERALTTPMKKVAGWSEEHRKNYLKALHR